jgi:cytochrome b561
MQSGSNPPQSYAASQKWLHWLVAVIVLFMLPVGYTMVRLPDGPLADRFWDLHRSFGLVVLALAIVRLAVRTARGAPPPYAGLTGLERVASTAAHHLLYVLIFLMPLLGWASESAFGDGSWTFFGLFDTPHILPANRPLSDILSRIHDWTALLLVAVLVAHIGGALMHTVVKRDGVMARMLPGRG